MKKFTILLLIISFIPFFYFFARAREIELNPSEFGPLVSPPFQRDSLGVRAVMKFEIEENICDNYLPSYAVLHGNVSRLDFRQQSRNRTIIVNTYMVTTNWSQGNVSWDNPWRNPGGDFDTLSVCMFRLDLAEDSTFAIDVTPIVYQYFMNPDDNHGLIVIPFDEYRIPQLSFRNNGFTFLQSLRLTIKLKLK